MKTILIVIFLSITALGDINSIALIKQAKFFGRFERFVKWPKSQNNRKLFIIGIIGNSPFKKKLKSIYANKTFTNKPIEIRHLKHLDEIKNCHILYIAPLKNFTLDEVLDSAKEKGVFLISYHKGWGEKGVHLNYYIDQAKNLKFELNPYTSKRDKIIINLKLLRLSKIVGTQ